MAACLEPGAPHARPLLEEVIAQAVELRERIEALRPAAPGGLVDAFEAYRDEVQREHRALLLSRLRPGREVDTSKDLERLLEQVYVELSLDGDLDFADPSELSLAGLPAGRLVTLAGRGADGVVKAAMSVAGSWAGLVHVKVGRDSADQLLERVRATPEAGSSAIPCFLFDVGPAVSRQVFSGLRRELNRALPQARFLRWLASSRMTLDELVALETAQGEGRRPGHYVVRGHPGTGKTTMLRCLARRLAEEGDGLLPVYVSLPRWARNDGKLKLPDFVRSEYPTNDDIDAVLALMANTREPGRVVLLLDGLDEVASRDRDRVRRDLRSFADQNPHLRIVVATRRIGYEPLGGTFREVELLKLERDRQRALLHNWFATSPLKIDVEAKTREAWAHLESAPSFSELREVPLYLTFIAMLFERGEEPKRLRHELYDQVLGHLLAGRNRIPELPMPGGEVTREALRVLAWFVNEREHAECTEGALVDALWAAVADGSLAALRPIDDFRNHDGNFDPRVFLRLVSERTGILQPDAKDEHWVFWHKSFREALVAEGIAKRAGGAAGAEWLASTLPQLTGKEGRWAEPFALWIAKSAEPDHWLREIARQNAVLARRALASVAAASKEVVLEILDLDGDDRDARCEQYARVVELVGDLEAGIQTLGELAARSEDCQELWYLREALRAVAAEHPEAADKVEAAEGRMFEHEAFGPRPSEEQVAAWMGPDGKPFWRVVRAGTSFTMGAKRGETGNRDELMRREITFAESFAIGATPITNARFAEFRPGFQDRESREQVDHPVVEVSWYDAEMYCAWAGLRLPSESEWEGACRAGSETAYWSGEAEEDLASAGWYSGNSEQRTHAVGEKPANGWGLFDVHGNVEEWCQDDWNDGAIDELKEFAWPLPDGSPLLGTGAVNRVVRGGSWDGHAGSCRSAYRNRLPRAYRFAGVGFRPASSSLTHLTTSPGVEVVTDPAPEA